MNKEECPVCKNNEYFTCDASSIDGTACLTSTYIETITLNICTKCGCVYVSKSDLDLYNRKMELFKVYFKGKQYESI